MYQVNEKLLIQISKVYSLNLEEMSELKALLEEQRIKKYLALYAKVSDRVKKAVTQYQLEATDKGLK